MKKILFGLCLVGLVLVSINPAHALEGIDSIEAATQVGIPGLVFPYTWTTAITSKAKVYGVYIKLGVQAATPQINIFLDSAQGATNDALLATDYMGQPQNDIGANYFTWQPTPVLILEKADEIRVVVGAPASTHSATQLGILIKGERL